ncbi:MAG: gamma-glutamyl-gamma-aminobutyrate hydrolase family protein [Trueperella sp.]|uniref:glutamine amidotransferase-related protein n=1 Tax=Trueperella sp. TaxID=2699835 RepID=UPI002A9178CF|nr:gamma-glutamyl-gamma-aminobutyrate hydrolase family protein [Trueperella sp.]MDY5404299.1 gamma-glutamyl-gamma-aminobutyrate hydrolase family protein [Trueperella sp.]
MKPFAFLAARPSFAAGIRRDEFAAIKRDGRLADSDIVYLSLEDRPQIDVGDYAGFIVSGSQYGFGDHGAAKTTEQIVTEEVLFAVVEEVLAEDLPFLGLCYGHQAIALALGGTLTADYGEELSTISVNLTDDGRADPIFSLLPDSFPAIVGHEDAIGLVPANTAVLASSALCPVQAIRYGDNVYGVQFHPEIDAVSVGLRLDYYGDVYFAAEEVDRVRAQTTSHDYSACAALIGAFVERYRR